MNDFQPVLDRITSLAEHRKAPDDVLTAADDQREKRTARASAMDRRYQGMTWDSLRASSEAETKAHAMAREYAGLFAERKADAWLILMGNRGTGKSLLCNLIAGDVASRGFQVMNRTAHEVYRDLKESREHTSESEFFRRMRGLDLLVISELGFTNRSEDERNFWRELTDMFYRDCVALVVATNLPGKEADGPSLGDYIDTDRASEMTRGHRYALRMEWESYRRPK